METQWALIKLLIPVYKWGCPRELDMQAVVNAILVCSQNRVSMGAAAERVPELQ